MKRSFILINAIVFSIITAVSVQAQSFSDVSQTHENYEAIENLKLYGIIQGYDDGTFKPSQTVNRVESLKIILLSGGIDMSSNINGNGGFPDVAEEAWFAPYVVKAKNLGIVKGNPDGSFQPAREVNLAELLKIVLLTNGITTDTNSTAKPYADVSNQDWFYPYFVYAQEHDLLDQSNVQNVYPGHAMTRGEIAEVIYRLRNVLTEAQTQTPQASFYADSLDGQLTASGEKYNKNLFTAAHRDYDFGTRVEVINLLNNKSVIVRINDRGPFIEGREIDLSKAAFEAISPLSKGVIPVSIQEIGEEVLAIESLTQEESCTWFDEGTDYETDYFHNEDENLVIDLYAPLRAHYRSNEVIDISGRIADEEAKEIVAVLKEPDGTEKLFSSSVHNGDFLLQIDIGSAGEKQLVLVSDNKRKNYLAALDVYDLDCEKALEDSVLPAVENPQFFVEDNSTILRWNIGNANLSRVVVQQGEHQVIRYFSQGKKGWKLPLAAFEGFSQGVFSVRVDTAQSNDGSLLERTTLWNEGEVEEFVASEHHFGIQDDDLIEVLDLSNTYGFGGDIVFSGRSKSKIRSEVAFITPSGDVHMQKLISEEAAVEDEYGIEVFPANTRFHVVFQPEERGTYIVELNHQAGTAVLNRPVYEEGKVPLVPDFRDINDSRVSNTSSNIQASAFSVELLNLVNQERKSALKDMLEIDDALSLLAQARADLIAESGVLSHWDAEGKSVNDIRLSYGITTSVGENLAQEENVKYAHLGLMRSAIHRKNILEDFWERAGFGFARAQDGGLIVVELFSSNPLEVENFPSLREEVLDSINSQRRDFLVPSAVLTAIAQNWSELMVESDFFDFESPQEQSLSEEVRKGGVVQTVGTFILGNTSWIDVRETIMQHDALFDNRWEKIGVGIAQDSDGIIKVTLLYSE